MELESKDKNQPNIIFFLNVIARCSKRKMDYRQKALFCQKRYQYYSIGEEILSTLAGGAGLGSILSFDITTTEGTIFMGVLSGLALASTLVGVIGKTMNYEKHRKIYKQIANEYSKLELRVLAFVEDNNLDEQKTNAFKETVLAEMERLISQDI